MQSKHILEPVFFRDVFLDDDFQVLRKKKFQIFLKIIVNNTLKFSDMKKNFKFVFLSA